MTSFANKAITWSDNNLCAEIKPIVFRTIEKVLWDLCDTYRSHFNLKQVHRILKDYPDLDINWKNEGISVLRLACNHGLDLFVAVLLGHPNIDVNILDQYHRTPLHELCLAHGYGRGWINCIVLLLNDPRTNVNLLEYNKNKPFTMGDRFGRLSFYEAWIASGREMDLTKSLHYMNTGTIKVLGRDLDKHKSRDLLVSYEGSPDKTRLEVRKKLRWFESRAAALFALVIYFCYGFLNLKKKKEKEIPVHRFMLIMHGLRVDSQIMICCRVAGLIGNHISQRDLDYAFHYLRAFYESDSPYHSTNNNEYIDDFLA